jgi:uncharacterized protein (DUF488 family)
MKDAHSVYSLGYQGMTLDTYMSLLKANGVSVVIDVRETPWSYKPGFSKKPLAERLEANGITYVHLKSAGNPSRNRKLGLSPQSVIDLYKKHLDYYPECLEEIYKLITDASGSVCLLCFEEQAHDCHRKVILDRLAETKDFVACHLHRLVTNSEETVIAQRVPQANNRERSGIHMEVA